MPPRERRGEDRGLDVGDLGEFIGGILRGAKDAQVVEHRQEYVVVWRHRDDAPDRRNRNRFQATDAIDALQQFRQEQRGAGAGGFVIRAIRPTGQD